MKLQHVIDAAFGMKDAERAPQRPSDAFNERERRSAEQAQKIQALRQARLAKVGADAPGLHVFEVVRYRGHWRTLHGAKRSSPYADQAAAILAAKKLAKVKQDQGHAVKVILQRTDGNAVIQTAFEVESTANPRGHLGIRENRHTERCIGRGHPRGSV